MNRYTDILEQTFLIRKLAPYYANIGKRLLKSPKVYFRDSGLLHYFLGIHQAEDLDVHPARGASWEGFVIDHILNAFVLHSPGSQAFYWRTATGTEVDLLVQKGSHLIPFEIKLHTSPTKKDAAGLYSCMEDLHLKQGYVVYPGSERYSLGRGVTQSRAWRIPGSIPIPSRSSAWSGRAWTTRSAIPRHSSSSNIWERWPTTKVNARHR